MRLSETEVGSALAGANWVAPAQSNSMTARASPNGVGVRASTPNFDSRGLCPKTPLLRALAAFPVDACAEAAPRVIGNGIDCAKPLSSIVVFHGPLVWLFG